MKRIFFIVPWSEYHIGRREGDFVRHPERAPEGVVKLAYYLNNMGAEIRIANMQYLLHKNQGSIAAAMDVLWDTCCNFGETDEDLELTEKLIHRTKPTSLLINRPGSKGYELHKEEIDAAITTLHDWTNLDMLNLSMRFGNMSLDRYARREHLFR